MALEDFNQVLFESAKKSDLNGVKRALVNGADINFPNAFMKWGPLHVTAGFCHNIDVLRYLISAGADVNLIDQNGRIPLHLAAKRDKEDVVALLIEANSNINFKSTNGVTPLFLAASSAKFNNCELLLAKNADPLIKSNKGLNCIEIAEEKGNEQITALLKGEPIPEMEKDPQMAQLESMLASFSQLADMKKGAKSEIERLGMDPNKILQKGMDEGGSQIPTLNETRPIFSTPQKSSFKPKINPSFPAQKRTPTNTENLELPALNIAHNTLRKEHEDLKEVVFNQQKEIEELKNKLNDLMHDLFLNV